MDREARGWGSGTTEVGMAGSQIWMCRLALEPIWLVTTVVVTALSWLQAVSWLLDGSWTVQKQLLAAGQLLCLDQRFQTVGTFFAALYGLVEGLLAVLILKHKPARFSAS